MTKPAQILIRDAAADDEAAWRRLWSGYCDFYQVDVPEAVTAFTWSRVLDPDVPNITLATMAKAAKAVGRELHITLA